MAQNPERDIRLFYLEHHEFCTNCKKSFTEYMPAHLGYLENGDCALLCEECASLLKKTIKKYPWSVRDYIFPEPNSTLWRYMDLSKFISLISTHSLYFASASSFNDPFEGAKGTETKRQKWDDYYLSFLRHAVSTVPGAKRETLTPEKVEADARRLLRELSESGELRRTQTYISCWHSNESESEAMWHLYSKDVTNAVAIRTTTEHLYASLDYDPRILIGRVNYIDFAKQYAPINAAFWYKRKSFEHEREVRAVIFDPYNKSAGISIPVDIDHLIDGIYVSPYSPKWFVDVVQSVVEAYKINKPIFQSELLATPFY